MTEESSVLAEPSQTRPDAGDPTGTPAGIPDRPDYSESMLAAMLGQYAVMQVVVAATGLIRNKVIALRLGPSAFGELAQLGAVVGAITAVTTFGMQVSLSRNAARATTFAERQAFLASANGLVLTLSFLAMSATFVLLLAGDLLTLVGLPVTPDVVVAAALSLAAIPLLGLQTNFLALLQGVLDVKGLAAQRSIAVLVATALCIPLVWFFGLVGAAANFLILNALLTLLLGLRCRSLGYRWLAVRLDREVIGVLLAFGIASMVAGFAQAFTDAAIRASLLKQVGADANGLLQAPLVLAATLQGIVLGSIGTMSLATLSHASNNEDTRRTIGRLLNVALPLSTVALGLLGLLGVPAMIVLYSGQFVGGASLLPWILCSGLVQVVVWVVGAPLLASGDRAIWVTLELVWNGARWAFAMALLPIYGVAAVPMAMLLAFVVHLSMNVVALRVRYGLAISWRYGARLLASMALVGLLSVIGAGWTASIPALIAATLIWLAYATYVARTSSALAPLRSLVPRR